MQSRWTVENTLVQSQWTAEVRLDLAEYILLLALLFGIVGGKDGPSLLADWYLQPANDTFNKCFIHCN